MVPRRILLVLVAALTLEASRVEADGWSWIYNEEVPYPLAPDEVSPSFAARKQYRRWWHRYKAYLGPNGEHPDIADVCMHDVGMMLGFTPGAGAEPFMAGSDWFSIGPNPIRSSAPDRPPDQSGQVVDIAVHPTNSNEWLIAASSGGVWRTTDNGDSWTPLTDGEVTVSVGAVAYSPRDPLTIYVGTGSYAYGLPGLGLLRSTDGGSSWQLLGEAEFRNHVFHDIRVDPTADPDVVIAATSNGIYRSVNGGNSWSLAKTGDATDLEIDSGDFTKQYAGIRGEGIYRSSTGGASWTPLPAATPGPTGPFNRIELALAPSDANVIYAADDLGDLGILRLWRSANIKAPTPTWVQIDLEATNADGDPEIYCPAQCDYNHDLTVKPDNPNILVAGGIRLWVYNHAAAPGVERWTDIGRPQSNTGIHVDHHTAAWKGCGPPVGCGPPPECRLIVGNDGGVWSSTDLGATWISHNPGLVITEFYYGSVHPTNPDRVMGGAQDNGTSRGIDAANAWDLAGGGDGGDNFFSLSDPDHMFALQTQNLSLIWQSTAGIECGAAESIADRDGAPFIGVSKLCPHDESVVIVGTNNLWKTQQFFDAAVCPGIDGSGRPTWTPVCNTATGELGEAIEAIAFAPGDEGCNTFAFGANNGELRLTQNGGTGTCTDLDPGDEVPNSQIKDVALHPCFGETSSNPIVNDKETIYVVTGGARDVDNPHVLKTTNALSGATWSESQAHS